MKDMIKRLKLGIVAYSSDNMSQNDFIDDVGISRNIFFELMKNPTHYNKLLPSTKRKIIEGLALLGF